MRSFLGFLAFTATLIALLVFVAGPLLVRPLVTGAVRAALPTTAEPLDVTVEVDGLSLLGGYVREIRLSGTDVTVPRATVGSIDLVARRVGLVSRDVDSLEGVLGDVAIPLAGGATVDLGEVELSGASSDVRAEAHLGPAAAEAVVGRALADAGVTVERIVLADDAVELEVLGQRITVPLAVADGAIVLPSVLGSDRVPVIEPAPADQWRITGLVVRPSGVEIVASIDVAALLAG